MKYSENSKKKRFWKCHIVDFTNLELVTSVDFKSLKNIDENSSNIYILINYH
jgi:hypothetical protein